VTNLDRAEMQALLDQFRRDMARENDVLLFDHEARQRIGEMIGKAVRQGGSELEYLRRRG
jgi:low affinity Fe/Cu permease